MEEPGNRVMYYLKDGPERAFVCEELMLIPEDTELPPEYVKIGRAFRVVSSTLKKPMKSLVGP